MMSRDFYFQWGFCLFFFQFYYCEIFNLLVEHVTDSHLTITYFRDVIYGRILSIMPLHHSTWLVLWVYFDFMNDVFQCRFQNFWEFSLVTLVLICLSI